MKEGDIVLIAMQQADYHNKRRPALVLRRMPKYGDLLVCGISSQIQQAVPEFDVIMRRDSNDYEESGLLTESVIRLGYLTLIPENRTSGTIGCVSQHLRETLLARLCNYLNQKSQ